MAHKFYSLWLGLIIILIFILQVVFPGFTEIFVLNQSAYTQIWRFLTAIFLHGSLVHLLYNLFALVFFGLILEKFVGSKKFLFMFFVSGIVANLFSVNFYNSALGASGAVFGVIGCLAVIRPMMTVWAFSLPMPLFFASILWAAGDLLGVFFPSNVANLAHLSGLGLGLIFGLIFRLSLKKIEKKSFSYEVKIPETYVRSWEDEFMG